jgi:hypothetical protein
MRHKFNIGAIVYYRPKGRMLETARGTYTVIGRMPAGSDQQPEYRIKHFSEDFERVAMENELSAGDSEYGQR